MPTKAAPRRRARRVNHRRCRGANATLVARITRKAQKRSFRTAVRRKTRTLLRSCPRGSIRALTEARLRGRAQDVPADPAALGRRCRSFREKNRLLSFAKWFSL